MIAALVLIYWLAGSIGAQSRSGRNFVRYNRPLDRAHFDLETGTVVRGPTGSECLNTVSDFVNLDLAGFVGVDTGGGNIRWFDAGIGGAAEVADDVLAFLRSA